ncbi:NTF2- export protein 2 [Linderina macrospora]|uniref:NTF2- export protein 2 n=1 Tax=Linderina macrospora TaxID=4868 RepID=A0ACC1JHT4_9FUNG|nr:NTF2- export protein 2 [Linderina macrospora]
MSSDIIRTANTAEKFVENYYRSWSKNVSRLYQDSSKVIWNGQGMSGAQFKEQLPELQKTFTHFEVRGFDVHQLGNSQMITVTGIVKYHKNVQFSQVFQVVKPGATTFILNDCFRLV